MPLQIVRNDLTKMNVDAIVNAANRSLLGGGGVDGAIHRAAGSELLAECRTLGGCETGEAKCTAAYRLPCRYVIHTVGPVWQGGKCGEQALLRSCYRSSLMLAAENGCESVAFPLISAGTYGYPKAEAMQIAVQTIRDFLTEHDMTVYLTVYDRESFLRSTDLYRDVQAYIDGRYVQAHLNARAESKRRVSFCGAHAAPAAMPMEDRAESVSLEELLNSPDESFSQMLLRKITEKGMTDAQCYKKANIDRKLFSKIRSDIHYKPSKSTALAFAVALELPMAETADLLRKAGFALSHSSKFDIIVEYFLQKGNYDIHEINETLFAFDQSLLGS